MNKPALKGSLAQGYSLNWEGIRNLSGFQVQFIASPREVGEGEKKLKKLTFLNQLGYKQVIFNRTTNNRDLNNIKFIFHSDFFKKLEVELIL